VSVAVIASALSLYRVVRAATAGRVGISNASRAVIGTRILSAAGIRRADVVIEGMEQDAVFAATFMAPRAWQLRGLDSAAMTHAVVVRAPALQIEARDMRAILIECGNFPPYATAVRALTGLHVYDLADAAGWLMAAQGGGMRSRS
jgi:hypothetical protein